MIKTTLKIVLLLAICFPKNMAAQSEVIFEKVCKGIRNKTEGIKVNDEKSYQKFLKNNEKAIATFALQTEATVSFKNIENIITENTDITLLYFKSYALDFEETPSENWNWIDEVWVHQNGQDTTALNFISKLPKLESLSIYYDELPEDFYILNQFKKLKDIQLIGAFNPNDVQQILKQLASYPNLEKLTISLDYPSDVGQQIHQLKALKSLHIIDNYSWISKGIENVVPSTYKINYTLNSQRKKMQFTYSSQQGKVDGFVKNDVAKIFNLPRYSRWQDEDEYLKNNAKSLPTVIQQKFVKEEPVIFTGTSNLIRSTAPQPNRQLFSINPLQNTIIHTTDGMTFYVPKNSFKDSFDTPITEPIQFSYRNVTDPKTLLASGAVTNYLSGRRKTSLRVFRAFDVEFNYKNQPVIIANKSVIKTVFPANFDTVGYWYFINTKNELWDDHFEPDYVSPIKFYKWKGQSTTDEKFVFDRSTFDQRFYNNSYYFLMDKEAVKTVYKKEGKWYAIPLSTKKEIRKINPKKRFKLKRGKALIKLFTSNEPKYTTKKATAFFIKERMEKTVFPELKAFKTLPFYYTDTLGKRFFRDKFIRKKNYSDIRIEYTAGASIAFITLKGKAGYTTFSVSLRPFQIDKLNQKYKAKFIGKYAKYKKGLDLRRTIFDNNLKIRFTDFSHKYAVQFPVNLKEKENTLRINDNGTYAYGNALNKQKQFNFFPQFLDIYKAAINVDKVFVLYKTTNLVELMDSKEIHFDLKTIEALFCKDKNGILYMIHGNKLRRLKLISGDYNTLMLHKISGTTFTDWYKQIKD